MLCTRIAGSDTSKHTTVRIRTAIDLIMAGEPDVNAQRRK